MRSPATAGLLAIGLIAAAVGAAAQAPPVLQAPPVRPTPAQPPATLPPGTIPGAPPGSTAAPAGADRIFVTPTAIDLEGATVYPPGVLDEFTRPVVGKRVAVSELFAVAQRIEARYRADGYFLTTVFLPAQRTGDGRIRIRVVEGFISNVVIEGDVGPVAQQAKRFLDKVTASRPANLRDVERYLLLTQDLPGISLKTLLRAGKEPGSSELVAQLRRSPWDGLFQVHNRGSKFIGPQQGTLVLALNSFTSLAERVEGTYFTTFDREQNFGQIAWSNFIGDEGLRLRAYAGRGSVKPGEQLAVIRYDGVLTLAGASLSFPVVRSRPANLNVSGGYDYYQSRADILGNIPFTRTSLSVLRLGADGNYRDGWFGVTYGSARLSQGVGLFGASDKGDPLLNRAGADPRFFKLNGEVSRLQGLWTDGGFSINLLGTISAQYSNDILPSNEKFFVGGDRLGRGYYAGQVTGDKALAGTVELQFNAAVPYALGDAGGPSRGESLPLQFYAFYDHGRVWNNAPLEARHVTARSAGAGIRVNFLETAAAELEAVRRFDRDVDGAAARRLNAWALYARLTAQF
ncbi:MAG TPA: ShlB/FhaC/HecB family hemolysin secretion/activation protein [Vineibacter sp.]|nr:ShlB/FhaC/HecB family hemolysin secretion/activation protein [Vineibacter sp.]